MCPGYQRFMVPLHAAGFDRTPPLIWKLSWAYCMDVSEILFFACFCKAESDRKVELCPSICLQKSTLWNTTQPGRLLLIGYGQSGKTEPRWRQLECAQMCHCGYFLQLVSKKEKPPTAAKDTRSAAGLSSCAKKAAVAARVASAPIIQGLAAAPVNESPFQMGLV